MSEYLTFTLEKKEVDTIIKDLLNQGKFFLAVKIAHLAYKMDLTDSVDYIHTFEEYQVILQKRLEEKQ